MFRFWSSDSRGSDKTLQVEQPMLDFGKPIHPWVSSESSVTTTTTISSPTTPKRRKQSNVAIASQQAPASSARKRARTDDNDEGDRAKAHKKVALSVEKGERDVPQAVSCEPDMDRARDIIEEQFSLEILLKHDELRLINQELAKCQVALEQLRRCHLIPYPQNVPTPEQMVNIMNGSGAALRPKSGEQLPQWAPPFGVTDGPYARHYAKWLIPDPKFDGIHPVAPAQTETSRFRTSVDGRSTRNSFTESSASQGRGRPVRGSAGQKLQALSSGYPPPKDKSGPCVLKRSDGKTVKLVCIDCHRENFSSTQGFINHCRIAHKRDFKSHEEAAVHCGHPIEVADSGGIVGEEKSVSQTAPPSGLVHPFVRENAMSESEACFSVVRRIEESLEMYRRGQLPGVSSIPGAAGSSQRAPTNAAQQSNFSPSADSPHLSRLLQSRGFNGNLGTLISESKAKVDLDQFFSPEDESSDEVDLGGNGNVRGTGTVAPSLVRVPARATMSPALATTRPTSSKGHPLVPYATPVPTPAPRVTSGPEPEMIVDDDMLDVDLSPHTAVSNNAPSLVSDDGEYDDSEADSEVESEVNDSIGAQSISDVDEIDIDDDHSGARSIRHHRGSTGAGAGTTVRLRKDDSKHVTFVSPIKGNGNDNQRRGGRR
ncbi:uncharacterized protein F4807DRAFT_462868 [Annulohypoxylon truncatum]|uniref:uncharacterized protein n=1 Tax=Annulohypoxylon truncatum TaxID=327061 RepID=UPI002007976E|nr:uncharacterized protein F4807DRAFT_462868 [Annulohypoxylon truncatum]KAI1207135.1 hypothetical protein F4807DRAFT_462868 [Annulohypoxylon truncatum]